MIRKIFYTSILSSTSLFAGWGTPFQVYNGLPAFTPASGIDSQGNGIVAYALQQTQDTFVAATQIVSGAPVSPVSFASGPVQRINISMNDSGNATVAWVEFDGVTSTNFIRFTSFLNNAWLPIVNGSDPALNNAFANSLPGIAEDSSNNAIAFWALESPTGSGNYTVAYNLLQSGTWTGENNLLTASTDFIPTAYLAGNSSGQGFAIWPSTGLFVLQGSYYNGVTWTNNLSISTDLLPSCNPPMDVVINSSQDALITWATQTGGVSAILFSGNSYGLTEPVYLSAPNFVTQYLATALNDAGDGAAAWISYNFITFESDLYIAFRLNNSWQPPLLLDTISEGINAFLSQVNIGLDNEGNAYVVWCRTDGGSNSEIDGSYLLKGATSPSPRVLISTDNILTSTAPSLSVNGSGQTLVSWSSGPFGSALIEAAVGIPSSTLSPPSDLSGKQVKNRFATQYERANVLTWSPSLDPSVQSYYIFRNGLQIGTVAASSVPTYIDHNQTTTPILYSVTAVNVHHDQSDPSTITLP